MNKCFILGLKQKYSIHWITEVKATRTEEKWRLETKGKTRPTEMVGQTIWSSDREKFTDALPVGVIFCSDFFTTMSTHDLITDTNLSNNNNNKAHTSIFSIFVTLQ